MHGFDRTTQDVDIFIEPTLSNARRTCAALENIGYDLMGHGPEDLLKKKFLFRGYLLETDIHPFVKGVSFSRLWRRRIRYRLEGVTAYFASLDDLITMKRAAGRGKDLDDLRYLETIRKLTRQKHRETKKAARRK